MLVIINSSFLGKVLELEFNEQRTVISKISLNKKSVSECLINEFCCLAQNNNVSLIKNTE